MDLSSIASIVEKLLSINDVAELYGVEPRIIRRLARKKEIPGVVKILGKVGFDPDALEGWTPPEPGVFGPRATKRDDGRRRYHIFLTEEERAVLVGQGREIVDPRELSKARRAARKDAKAEAAKAAGVGKEADATAGAESPFADFDL